MPYVNVRTLRGSLSQILRDVRERQEEYLITYHGRVIARLSPVLPAEKRAGREQVRSFLQDLDRLAAEIAQKWPEGVTALDAVRDGRREL